MTDLHCARPELLAPAGSPDALAAAVGAGADAVYLGGSLFNARMNAHNFDKPELEAAVSFAHKAGARVYLTLNTLIYDRELDDAVSAAYEAAACGVDGLIIADLGAAARIHCALPALPLHASTQMSGHRADVGHVLSPLGFSRFVIAREASRADLEAAVKNSGMEVEVFIHGALCVSHSGQCLLSSLVGGRSGNRGLCAQPCRLPYKCADRSARRDEYPLSLKDLSLARHVPALLDAGVASLKIEGRMKSPAYVGGVVSIWRRLLDERRGADDGEMEALAELFSREGFTDGYFTGRISHRMLGVRSDADKARTAVTEKASPQKAAAALPTSMRVSLKDGEPMTLTVTAPLFRQDSPRDMTVTVTGDVPMAATNPAAALTEETLCKQLCKTGGTPYRIERVEIDADAGLILPVSRLNALRREAVEALDAARMAAMPTPADPYDPAAKPVRNHSDARSAAAMTAQVYRPSQITAELERAIDIVYIPLIHWDLSPSGKAHGVVLPPVIFDRETGGVRERLADVLRRGARDVLIGNVGHLPLVREVVDSLAAELDTAAIRLHGDLRLNVTNAESADVLLSMGFCDLILSPELTLPRLRDISDAHVGRASAVIYGRIPMMLLEKCAIRALYDTPADKAAPCGKAGVSCAKCARDAAVMVDRRGVLFPILRELDHRNVVYNSLPISMTDREEELVGAHITRRHFIFTTETPEEVDAVLRAAKAHRPVGGEVRRIVR